MKLKKLLPGIALSVSLACLAPFSMAEETEQLEVRTSPAGAATSGEGVDNILEAIRESIDIHPQLQAKWNAFFASEHDTREAFVIIYRQLI